MTTSDDTKKLIEGHRRRLQKLKERQSVEGISTPPEVLIEIENIEAELETLGKLSVEQDRLQQTLAELGGLSSPIAGPIEQRLAEIERLLRQSALFEQRSEPHFKAEPVAASADLQRGYLHRLVQQTRRLPLDALDPKAAGNTGSHELQLAAVYTALLTQQAEQEIDLKRSGPDRGDNPETRLLSALELLAREQYLVLLGEPGSGKSTFVNFVGLCLAGALLNHPDVNLATLNTPPPTEERQKDRPVQPWQHGPLLPVRIVLRDLAAGGLPAPDQAVNGDTLWRFIENELGTTLKGYAPHLKKTLQEAGGLILLDGLDEVPDANQRRRQVKQVVQGFVADFPRCRFLVTSRTYAYQRQDWKLEGFAEAVLRDFSPVQVSSFVERWYAHIGAVRSLTASDAEGRASLLQSAIAGNPRLAELAGRPLLLTLMASLHAWRGGSLPENREELYADAVDLLLDQWESPKVVRDGSGRAVMPQPSLAEWLKVDRKVVRTELNRLAFAAHYDQPELVGTADIGQSKLVAALLRVSDNPEAKPRRLEEYLRDRAGLLAARGEGVYTFPHRTFQEYLAACHLTDDNYPDRLAALLKADPQRWREATLLAGAKAARGSAAAVWLLAEELCHQSPPAIAETPPEADCWGALLAGQTLLENGLTGQVSDRNRAKLENIRLWLRLIVDRGYLPPIERFAAGNALAALGDDRNLDERIEIPAGTFLMGADDGFSDEKPQHEITLPAYRIGKYPVTNGQFAAFMAAGGYQARRFWPADGWQLRQDNNWLEPRYWHNRRYMGLNRPVVGVSWYEALAYCAWLTEQWQRAAIIGAAEVVRLPTEAEWEKAARGRDGRQYPWGNTWDEGKCNTSESQIGETSPVGIYPTGASPFGCLDMAGNIWEWTISLWGEDISKPDFTYPYHSTDGRENLSERTNVLRVVRGGSWYYFRNYARCAYRLRFNPDVRYDVQGFRVVVAPISTSAL